VYEGLHRLPDAISAYTRALFGADRHQTPTILQKLASLYSAISLAECGPDAVSLEAINCHRRLLALGEQSSLGIPELAPSYLIVAEWEMRDGQETADAGVAESDQRGNWALAHGYLEKVAGSNVPQRDKAEEMLRELRLREARLAAGGGI